MVQTADPALAATPPTTERPARSPNAAPFFDLLDRSSLMELRRSPASNLRHEPPTERSRQVVEQILDAAATLLATMPFHRITTHRVAEAAGVNIAVVYRFYADLNAILRELALRREIAQCEAMAEALPALVATDDWRSVVGSLVETLGKVRAEVPEGPGVITALMTVPELRPVVTAGRETRARLGALALSMRDPSRTPDEWFPIVRTSTAAAGLGLDEAYAQKVPDRERIELTKLLVVSFLANFLRD